MSHKFLRSGMLLAAMLATLALPSESQACWFTHCFDHAAAPAPAPTYGYAPAYMPAPTCAAYAPAPSCNPCSACSSCGTTCGYAPQTCYQPVTSYTPVTTLKPVSSGCGCPWFGGSTTAYRPVTSYMPTTSYMPVTSYQPACTANYAPCSTCATGCSSFGGGGCSSCGTTTANTTYYESAPSASYPSQPSSPSCSTCGATASAPAYTSVPSATYSSATPAASGGVSTFQPGPAATSVQAPLMPLNNGATQGVQKPIPDAKSEGGAVQSKQMSDPAPRLLDPRDRTASMPIMRSWSNTTTARTVSDVRPAAVQVDADDTDADGWHAPRGR